MNARAAATSSAARSIPRVGLINWDAFPLDVEHDAALIADEQTAFGHDARQIAGFVGILRQREGGRQEQRKRNHGPEITIPACPTSRGSS